MATRATYPIFKAFTSSGTFGIGYKLYTYEAGTTTLLTTYQDEAETTPHTNPIILDSLGEAEIFITEAAKFTLTDADGNVQTGWPVDDIDPTTVTASEVEFTPTGTLTSTNVQDAMEELSDEFADLSAQFTGIPVVVGTTSGVDVIGGVMGFDVTVTDTNELTVQPGVCLDSTLSYQMTLDVAATVDIPTTANTIYHLFVVRLEADNESFEIRAYTAEAGVASDAEVDAWRWIGYWVTNGSNACRSGVIKDGELWWTRLSENTINSTTNPPAAITTAIDISSFLPISRARSILFGGVGTTAAQIAALSFVSGTAMTVVQGALSLASSGQVNEWNLFSYEPGFIPVLGDNLYWGEGGHTNDAGTLQLAIHAVRLRR